MATLDNSNNTQQELISDSDQNQEGDIHPLVESSGDSYVNFVFNLGQLNVDICMNTNPTFASPEEVDLSGAHFQADINWYSDINKGWHKLFRFQVDGDNPVRDASNNAVGVSQAIDGFNRDIRYFTDPNAWLVGSDLVTNNLQGVNVSANGHMDTSWNLLESVGDNGIDPSTNGPFTGGGVTLKLNSASRETNNKLATGHEDSIAKDFLRHIANEIMGGYAAGAKKGVVDIFNNEEALLNDLHNHVNDTMYSQHHALLVTTSQGYATGDTTGVDVREADQSSNIVELYGTADTTYNTAQSLAATDKTVKINVMDTSANMAAEILKQILKSTQTELSFNGIDRLDNLLTPNDAGNVWLNDDGEVSTTGLEKGDNNYDYRRRRHKKDYMELLQAGDVIAFILEINPKTTTPLGNNPINSVRYKVMLHLKDRVGGPAYNTINNLGN